MTCNVCRDEDRWKPPGVISPSPLQMRTQWGSGGSQEAPLSPTELPQGIYDPSLRDRLGGKTVEADMGPLGTDELPVVRKNCIESGQLGGLSTCRQGMNGISRSRAG